MNFESFDFHGSLVSNGRLAPGEVHEAAECRQGIPGLLSGWCLMRQYQGIDVRRHHQAW